MNKYENNEYSPPDDEQELLKDLMPKLGMETTAPTGKYKTQARVKYLLPRVLIVAAALAVAFFLGSYLTRPAEFHNVSVREDPTSVEVDFDVDRLLLLESVTATLDGKPAAVTREDMGSYQVSVQKNGELAICTRTFTGKESTQTISVDAIDDEPPHMTDSNLEDGVLTIYFTDGDGTGIDWESIRATSADSGEPFALDDINPEEEYVRFPFPDHSLRIYLEDHNDNPLSVLLTLMASEDADLHE